MVELLLACLVVVVGGFMVYSFQAGALGKGSAQSGPARRFAAGLATMMFGMAGLVFGTEAPAILHMLVARLLLVLGGSLLFVVGIAMAFGRAPAPNERVFHFPWWVFWGGALVPLGIIASSGGAQEFLGAPKWVHELVLLWVLAVAGQRLAGERIDKLAREQAE